MTDRLLIAVEHVQHRSLMAFRCLGEVGAVIGGADGFLFRRALDTAGLPDAGRPESLIEQILAVPPYWAAPGRLVYVIYAGDRAIVVGEAT